MVRLCQCGVELKKKQKKYCSVSCQYDGLRVKKVARVVTNCLMCGVEIVTTENKLKIGKSKYCSKICNNEHKKVTYKGENNPSFGKPQSDYTKKLHSDSTKKLWCDEGFREKVKRGKIKFMNENGYWPGTDKKSLDKKKKTNMMNYNTEHIGWNIPEIREKAESTCLNRYGKYSWQIGYECQEYQDTDIEVITENILKDNNIEYRKQFRVYYNGMRYKKYDFFLPNYNLIIECDGDYWHGNPAVYEKLNENQLKNKMNDDFKNQLATNNGYRLLRFWGSDIKYCDFPKKLISQIY
jgi:very-short-patch-repair endonuclease